jgi:hypothetical protein
VIYLINRIVIGGDDHQDQIQNVENAEDDKSDQHQTEHARDQVIDQHRDLKIERLLSVLVDLGGIPTFDQPNNQRTENVTGPRYKKNPAKALAWQSTVQVRTFDEVVDVSIGLTFRLSNRTSVPLAADKRKRSLALRFFYSFDVRAKFA